MKLAYCFAFHVTLTDYEMCIEAVTFRIGAYSTQEQIELWTSKNDEGLPILRAFCGSAIITNILRSRPRLLRGTLLSDVFCCGSEDQ